MDKPAERVETDFSQQPQAHLPAQNRHIEW
jgi:hypothetical protein